MSHFDAPIILFRFEQPVPAEVTEDADGVEVHRITTLEGDQ